MPVAQLMAMAILAMAALATLRVVRVHLARRTPLPEGRGGYLFLAAFIVVPPIALSALAQPSAGILGGIGSLPAYVGIVAVLAILMWLVARILGQVIYTRPSRLVRLALVGNEGDAPARADPPLSAALAESVQLVDRANAAFPRGPGFPSQIDRPGFRSDWDALDGATRALEGRIAEDRRLGLGVAPAATFVADDARSRLSTLHGLAAEKGQAWAVGRAGLAGFVGSTIQAR